MKTAKELLTAQNTSPEENPTEHSKSYSKKTQEREIEHIKGTPFSISRMGAEDEWRISIGNQLMENEGYKSKWRAKRKAKKITWEMIWRTAIAINLKMNKQ